MMPTIRNQSGFTAIELLVVLSLMSLVAGMAASGVVGAQRKAKVNNAVAGVEQAVSHARKLARGRSKGDNYQVVIDGAAETKGVRVEYEDQVVFEHRFGPHVHFFVDGQPSASEYGIYFANGTGFTSDASRGLGKRVTLGCEKELVLASPDGRIAYRFTIYEVGLVRTVEQEL